MIARGVRPSFYRMGRDAIAKGEAGGPYAYVIAPDQWDGGEAEFGGHPRGTFKLLLNALHGSTLPRLPGRPAVTAAATSAAGERASGKAGKRESR